MKRYLFILLLLTSCSDTLSPDHCRSLGVDVANNATQTGIIVEEHKADINTVKAKCRRPFSYIEGCAVPVAEHEYVLWYIDDAKVRDHERCHALYEEKKHI